MILNNLKYRGQWRWLLVLACLGLLAGGLYWLRPTAGSTSQEPPLMEIRTARHNLFGLRLKRDQAIREEILFNREGETVRAWLNSDTGEIPVRMRLKGDWTDHLQEEKWSFRIQCAQGTAWNRLRTFSLQSPHTRSFLDEWELHQFLQKEDLLTPRYDFVRLHINGADMGIYALEEHFAKELPEARGRREGPLLKFDESGLWEVRKRQFDQKVDLTEAVPVYAAMPILPFQSQRTLENDTLRSQFLVGQNLMFQYKHGLVPPSQFIDLEAMGKSQAALDMFGAHHALYWSNTRFYFNPITCKLEPVLYDGFAEPNPEPVISGPFLCYGMNASTTFGDPAEGLGTRLLAEPAFLEAYYGALHTWSQPDFADQWTNSQSAATQLRESWLQSEFLLYRYRQSRLVHNAEIIHTALADFDPKRDLKLTFLPFEEWVMENHSPLALKVTWFDLADSTHQVRYLEAKDPEQPARIYNFFGVPDRMLVAPVGSDEGVEVRESAWRDE